jgi:hypothetical protein
MTALAARQLNTSGEKIRSSGTDHQDVVLDTDELADPEVRARVIQARDLPTGLGDMDASLYLLFRAVRERSTVALSGESADEVFGGYQQFFDPEARAADTFPWLALFRRHIGNQDDLLTQDFAGALDLGPYVRDSYRQAVSGIPRLDGESDFDYQMLRICDLHLTRFVRREEPSPRGHRGPASPLDVLPGEEPLPLHAGPRLHRRAAEPRQGTADQPSTSLCGSISTLPRLPPADPDPGCVGDAGQPGADHALPRGPRQVLRTQERLPGPSRGRRPTGRRVRRQDRRGLRRG